MALWKQVEQEYRERTPTSERLHRETREHVPAGVASTVRAWDPYPAFIEKASGAYLHDVDGNQYLDFAMNNGAGMVGHAHPAITEAVSEQLQDGTLYSHPHRLLGEAARELKKRWSMMDLVRFTQSGMASTLHAIRVARAYSGRDTVVKIEGNYHGAHDYSLLSVNTPERLWGHESSPVRVPESDGIPSAVAETVEIAPFNNIEALEELFAEQVNEIGAIIVEPLVLNSGVIEPRASFLEDLRDLCDEYGVVYIFDEVKTGVKIAPGGAVEYYGVEPDLVTLAKSIGGNFPVGAFGGKEEIMRIIENGAAHYGTYNGNPLVLRALVTVLRDVLTDEAYQRAYELNDQLVNGYRDVMEDVGLRGNVLSVATQGMPAFTDEPITDYRAFHRHIDPELQENFWFSMVNEGVLPRPHGANQEWTISVQHTEEHVQEHLEAFKSVAPTIADRQ